MSSPSARAWALLPIAVALLAFANSLPGDFVYDDVLMIEKNAELRDFSLRRIFLENYWGAERVDRNYRPLTLLSYAINFRISAQPWAFHAVNVILNAAVAALAYFVLLEIVGNVRAAALGAALYAVLPIHTEAVSNVVGRAELFGSLAILGAWLCVLKSEKGRGRRLVSWAALITFLGIFAKENVIVVPLLLLASGWILRRRVPWPAVVATASSCGAYLVARAAVVGDRRDFIAFSDNPLVSADAFTRALNGIALLGKYLLQIVAPLHLSADYSYDQIPVRSPADPLLWAWAAGVLGIAALALWSWRRGKVVVALAGAFFGVTFALTANILMPIGTMYGERLAFTPSFAYPLAICGALASPRATSSRALAWGVLLVLIAAYGARTWTRNQDWSSRVAMYLRMPIDAARSEKSFFKEAEAHIEIFRKAVSLTEKNSALASAERATRHSMEIYPEGGKAEAKLAEVLQLQGRHAEAVDHVTRAIATLLRSQQLEPAVFRLRGESLLALGQYAKAHEDFSEYVRILESLGARPDPAGFNFRGLCLALQGKLSEALEDFNRAIAMRQDWPELWNNRAMCRLSLKDAPGAVEDWKRGVEVCRSAGLIYIPGKDCVHSFLVKLESACRAKAELERANGQLDAAARSEEEALRHGDEAKSIESSRAHSPHGRP